jgi:hypothetical protein
MQLFSFIRKAHHLLYPNMAIRSLTVVIALELNLQIKKRVGADVERNKVSARDHPNRGHPTRGRTKSPEATPAYPFLL